MSTSELYSFRDRKYANDKRQILKLAEFAAHRNDIPLDVNWSERWYSLPVNFKTFFKEVFALETRPDDVYVVTFMKCGTTWMQEAAWLIQNDLNYEGAKAANIQTRSPYLDWTGCFPHIPNCVEPIKNAPSPRLIKSHLPGNFLPSQVWQNRTKIIYVARNVKDAVVSSYHFVTGLGGWEGNMAEYVEDFINDEIVFTPFWERTIDFWKMRNEPNVLFVTYEEMKRDLAGVLQKLCKFMDKPQLNEEQLKKVMEHLSFDKMKVNKNANSTEAFKDAMPSEFNINKEFQFMRRGIIGSYKDELSSEDIRKLDVWSTKILEKHGLKQEDIFGVV